MVENIFGRKSYPQTKYHERAFLQSHAFTLHHRRISGEPPNLRTIAETDDADDDIPSQNLLPPTHSDLGVTVLPGRKPRAISLPTIYRDGSYLRINFPVQPRNEETGRRRFSEPAVSWSSKFHSAIAPLSNDKKLPNDKVSCVAKAQEISLCSFPQDFQIEKRRHSDPLIYTSDIIQKFENLTTDSQKNIQDSKPKNAVGNSSTGCSEKNSDITESQQPENVTSAAPTRRRKSSLVPIPFSIVKSCSLRKQKARPSKRRLSFPLSKNEKELTTSLPTLHKLAWIDNDMNHYGSSNESLKSVDLFIRKDSLDEFDLPAEDDDIPEKKHSCEEIITQWMKFFG
ncbi:uncharacterized protein LOC116300064 [Actinia tenebrosa]|uniref:Uncharacterized protein LOC116300064 n=1 Tax=Actinia tenebrosa TaxID=6105 RepID=A0A6P8I804_ACTTE|nr:uncharacterized protein LOC116300064 [Actinia tenebrosa]